MLKIRQEQFDALASASFERILDRWALELGTQFPDHTTRHSEVGLRVLLAMGATQAAAYGITDLINVREYLELLLRFGADSTGSPTTPWMSEILRDPTLNSTEKMDRIAAMVEDLGEEDDELEFENEESDDDIGETLVDENELDRPVDPKFDVAPEPGEIEDEVDDEW